MKGQRNEVKLLRRTAIAVLATTMLGKDYSSAQPSQLGSSSFDDLLAEALKHPDLLEMTRQEREGLSIEFDIFATKAVAPRYKPSHRTISDSAIRLIIAFEVTSRAQYELHQQPFWPGGHSGVTIGIGYDLGYATPEWLAEDWANILTSREVALLAQACRTRGQRASNPLPMSFCHYDTYGMYEASLRNGDEASPPDWHLSLPELAAAR